MQLLMVLLLALIAMILAPGLVWFFAAGAAAYGVIIAVGAIITFTLILGSVLWPAIRNWQSKRNTDAKIREANRIFREKEAVSRSAGNATLLLDGDEYADDGDIRRSCGKCQMEMPANSRRCPSCGHKVSL